MTEPTRVCYAIVDGYYSDYVVNAVFTTKELAEQQLPKYGDGYDDARIEEFSLDPIVPAPPAGMKGFSCYSQEQGIIYARNCSDKEMTAKAIGIVDSTGPGYRVSAWARDKDHAIKIASEKFAHQKAIDLGIAL